MLARVRSRVLSRLSDGIVLLRDARLTGSGVHLRFGNRALHVRLVPTEASFAPLPCDLDLVGGWLTATRSAVSFVQVGAFDGNANDPLYRNVHEHGWRGVLVEPQIAVFERLRDTYAGVTGLEFLNVAIAEEAGTRPMYYIQDVGPGDPWWYGQVASFDRAHVVKHLKGTDSPNRVAAREVPTMTINEVLAMAPQPVDVLQVDAEGYDAAIVGTMDLDRFEPAVIRFEHAHLSMREQQALTARLRKRGYLFSLGREDTIAVKFGSGA
jgi:FkbM family methyltransferase